jgi:hypothetical protein
LIQYHLDYLLLFHKQEFQENLHHLLLHLQ